MNGRVVVVTGSIQGVAWPSPGQSRTLAPRSCGDGRRRGQGAAATTEVERSGATTLLVEARIRDERPSFPTAIAFERRLTGSAVRLSAGRLSPAAPARAVPCERPARPVRLSSDPQV
jgi:hypothetical protein